MSAQKSVLVTGCSAGGIGAAAAQQFAEEGNLVFVTARTPSRVPPELHSLSNVEILLLDVTDKDKIAEAARVVREKTGSKLDVLVNNAGMNFTMPCLDSSLEDGKKLFDTNFWGVLAVCQAFAPLLIRAKGVIVNVSSIAGYLNTPYMGLYSASKAALTCASETLRLELQPFGVAVVTLVAGNVQTEFWQKEQTFALPSDSMYLPIHETIAAAASGKLSPPGSSAAEFSRQLRTMALSRTGGLMWKGAMAGTVRLVAKLMPTSMMDRALSDKRGLDVLAEKVATGLDRKD